MDSWKNSALGEPLSAKLEADGTKMRVFEGSPTQKSKPFTMIFVVAILTT